MWLSILQVKFSSVKFLQEKIFWEKSAKILSYENFPPYCTQMDQAFWASYVGSRAVFVMQYHLYCSIYTSSKWNFLRCCSQVLRWHILHFSTFSGPFETTSEQHITPRWYKHWIIVTLATKCYYLVIDQQHVLPFSSSGWIQSDRKEQQKTSPKCRSSLQGENGKASVLTM